MGRALLVAGGLAGALGVAIVVATFGSSGLRPVSSLGSIHAGPEDNVCGDGNAAGDETCDDGGLAAGDGCSATCTVEAGYACTGSPSICSDDPEFYALLTTSGLSNLSRSLTINGVTVEPSIWCEGQDAGASTWACDYGGTLDIAGSGAGPTLGVAAPFTDGTGGVGFSGAKYYDSDGTPGDVGTEDFAVEHVFRTNAAGVATYLVGTGSSKTWYITKTSLDVMRLTIDDGGAGSISCAAATPVAAFTVYHILCAVNRDENSTNGMVCYLNGASMCTADPSTHAGSLVDATDPGTRIGAFRSANLGAGEVASLAVWKRSDWHKAGADGPAEWATIAKQRFQQLAGVWPTTATTYPATFTRASTAALPIYTDATSATALHWVGSGWPRVAKVEDTGEVGRSGAFYAAAVTNKIIQSNAFATTWAKIDSGDTITDNGATDPFGAATGELIKPDATDGDHGVSQTVLHTAVAHTFSVYVDPGAYTWAYLSDDTVANATAYFNAATCTAGTVGAGATAHVDALQGSDGAWCRIGITYTGTAANHTLRIQCAEADGDKAISGDGATTACALSHAQLEVGTRPMLPVLTTTAAATKAADVTYYTQAGTAAGTLFAYVLCPATDQLTATGILSLSDGTSGESMVLGVAAAGDAPTWTITDGSAAQVAITGTTDIYDGAVHTLRATWSTTSNTLYVDGVSEGVPDTSATMPTTTRLYHGLHDGSGQSSCKTWGVKIYDEIVTP
jgi:cysteine-rich repeat protein